jgi:sigma-B regulation protein RsbU (phosphoserine phosphatase)
MKNADDYPSYPASTPLEVPSDPLSTTLLVIPPGVDTAVLDREAMALSSLDPVMRSVYASDPRLSLVYVGSASGVTRVYPWSGGLDPAFDPRTRSWFQNAVSQENLTWSEPYIDVLGHGLTVTCSVPVRNSPENWTWVIGSDVTIETINRQIIQTQIGGRGYAMLLDSEGNVISRPGLKAGDLRWDESFQTENLFSVNNSALQGVAARMIAGERGIAKVPFADGERYVAYAPVDHLHWSVGIVMPVEDVIAPALRTGKAISSSATESSEHVSGQMGTIQQVFLATLLVFLVAVGILSYQFSRMITRPLELLKSGSESIGKGNLDNRVEIESGDEFEDLAHSFNQMAADLKARIADLKRTTAEKERMEKELEIARGIQQSFLPDAPPSIPGIEIAARNIPAMEVGGDFYDFIPVSEHHWGLVIADVSGKGVPAALFMALSRTLVRASTASNPDPARSIAHANRLICADSKTSMFVTLFYAILDPSGMTISYVNAGHNPPLLLHQGDAGVVLLKARGVALGVIEELELESVTLPIRPGDLLVLYTDGVTEAVNREMVEFGEARLEEAINRHRNATAGGVIIGILDAITAFIGEQPQHDDITLVVLKSADEQGRKNQER